MHITAEAGKAMTEKKELNAEKVNPSKKEKKPKKKLIISLSSVALVIIAAAVIYILFRNDIAYAMADSKLEKGEPQAARQIFCELGSFEDSSERVMQIDYSAACTAMQAGSYSEAIAMFEALAATAILCRT